MDHPPSHPKGPQAGPWIAMAVLISGLLILAVAFSQRPTLLGGLGLLLAVLGVAGLWFLGRTLLKEARGRQNLLLELNQGLDEQVTMRTQRLMKTIEDLESFNRMVTHDLNSPLTSLMLGLELLQEQMAKDPQDSKQPLVNSISASAARMHELIHDLRQLALTSGRITVIQAVDMSYYASLVLRTLRERDPERSVVWHIEPGLIVRGDPSLIRIALENILGNAWKFTLNSHPADIRIQRGAGADMVIDISDNGCGFDPGKADRLFQPFFRMHQDAHFPGSGLGLSIVKRVMSRHGGHVTACSTPGKGTTFRLAFPMGFDLHSSGPVPVVSPSEVSQTKA